MPQEVRKQAAKRGLKSVRSSKAKKRLSSCSKARTALDACPKSGGIKVSSAAVPGV